jgi:hypothetical protein
MEELAFNIRGHRLYESTIYDVHLYAKYSIILIVMCVIFLTCKNIRLTNTRYIRGKIVSFD